MYTYSFDFSYERKHKHAENCLEGYNVSLHFYEEILLYKGLTF